MGKKNETVVILLTAYESLLESEAELEKLKDAGLCDLAFYKKAMDADVEEEEEEEEQLEFTAAELYPNGEPEDWRN